jgi:hypothetical protein
MLKRVPLAAALMLGLILVLMAGGQSHHHPADPSSNGDTQGATAENPDPSTALNQDQMDAATHAMHGHHMEGGPHMKMTEVREAHPGDQQRADEVIAAARRAMDQYKDYRTALKDGYKIFLPNIPQPQYHFTNNWYGFEAAFRFNPDHPTSLLYEKTKDGYKLIGAMYTAPVTAMPDDLDQRIPLSVAQWHLHVNFCMPPADRKTEMFRPNPKCGLAGSISTKEACDQAGGKFVPHFFGWMIHVYPNEKDPAEIWALGSEHDKHAHMHMN